jgi:hypothetical protein
MLTVVLGARPKVQHELTESELTPAAPGARVHTGARFERPTTSQHRAGAA